MERFLPYIYDVLLLIVLARYFRSGRQDGFVSRLIKLAGYAAAFVGAFFIAAVGSIYLYDMHVHDRAVSAVKNVLPTSGAEELIGALSETMALLPAYLGGLGQEDRLGLDTLLSGAADNAASLVVDSVISPPVMLLLRVGLFLLAFMLLLLVVRLIARGFGAVNRIPLLGGINRLAGGVVGLAQATLILLVFSLVLCTVVSFTGGKFLFLSAQTIDGSILFRHLYSFAVTTLT